MSTLYHLIYSSKAITEMLPEQLEQLVKQARFNNFIYQVTGLLLYGEQQFIQVLEGDKSNVIDIFEAILKDNRHHEIQVSNEGFIEQRAFPNWNMGFTLFSLHPELEKKLACQFNIDKNHTLFSNFNASSVVDVFSQPDFSEYII